MNNMPENIHYRVGRIMKGKYKALRALYWTLAVLIIIVAMIYIASLNFFLFAVFALPVVGFVWGAAKIIYPFLKLSVDYDYEIVDKGTFKLSYVYGKRLKPQTSCKVKDMDKIAPYEPNKPEVQRDLESVAHVYKALPDMDNPSKYAYYALFKDEKGENVAAIFEVSPTILRGFIFYNSENTVRKEF